jgi:hypothetical protein
MVLELLKWLAIGSTALAILGGPFVSVAEAKWPRVYNRIPRWLK